MNIRYLKEHLSRLEEVAVIGRNAEIGGVVYHVMGMVRSRNCLQLLILQYDEEFCQRTEEAVISELSAPNIQPDTNRAHLRGGKENVPVCHFRTANKAIIDGMEFKIVGMENKRCSVQRLECVAVFTEFLYHGWQPDGIDYQNIDELFMLALTLDGDYTTIPVFNDHPAIRFTMLPSSSSHLVEQPVTLHVGGQYPEKLWFQDTATHEKHWIQINEVYLCDMWAEMTKTFDDPRLKEQRTPEEIARSKEDFEKRMAEICPKGMGFPIIEYECEEDISLQFYTQAWLDSKPVFHSSSMGFFVKPEKPNGVLGLKLKAAIIQEAMPSDTVSIAAELFWYHKTTVHEDIVLTGDMLEK